MPPTTDDLPPAMSTRFQSRPPPPIPSPMALKSTPKPGCKNPRTKKRRLELYSIKKKDKATDPVYTPDDKEEDEEEEDATLL